MKIVGQVSTVRGCYLCGGIALLSDEEISRGGGNVPRGSGRREWGFSFGLWWLVDCYGVANTWRIAVEQSDMQMFLSVSL